MYGHLTSQNSYRHNTVVNTARRRYTLFHKEFVHTAFNKTRAINCLFIFLKQFSCAPAYFGSPNTCCNSKSPRCMTSTQNCAGIRIIPEANLKPHINIPSPKFVTTVCVGYDPRYTCHKTNSAWALNSVQMQYDRLRLRNLVYVCVDFRRQYSFSVFHIYH